MCLLFVLLFWQAAFLAIYTAVLVANVGFATIALPKWFREVRSFGRTAPLVPRQQETLPQSVAAGDPLPTNLIEKDAHS